MFVEGVSRPQATAKTLVFYLLVVSIRRANAAYSTNRLLSESVAESTIAEVGKFDDLHGAGIEIQNASRREYQVELQPEPVRSYGIGW